MEDDSLFLEDTFELFDYEDIKKEIEKELKIKSKYIKNKE